MNFNIPNLLNCLCESRVEKRFCKSATSLRSLRKLWRNSAFRFFCIAKEAQRLPQSLAKYSNFLLLIHIVYANSFSEEADSPACKDSQFYFQYKICSDSFAVRKLQFANFHKT